MTVTLSEFAKALAQILGQKPPGYVTSDALALAILEAARLPPAEVFEPTMMYLGGSRTDYLVVTSVEEMRQAERNGYITRANPQFLEGYPRNLVEMNRARGSDYRRIHLRSPEEEAQFRKVTNADEWTEDAEGKLAGRACNLSELTSEREAARQLVLHAELEPAAKK
jgi:hypothetical protein